MSKWKKKEFKRLTWEEFDQAMNNLWKDLANYLRDNKLQPDAVVPILRGAMVPAQFLVYRLNMLTLIPVQYKYFFKKNKAILKQIIKFDQSILSKKDPVLITVEDNLCYGLTSQTAINDIKKILPESRIIHCALHADYTYFPEIHNVEAKFFGRFTNECRTLDPKECKKLNIFPGSHLLPWEDIKEEWTTVKGEQYEFTDVEKTEERSTIKEEIDF